MSSDTARRRIPTHAWIWAGALLLGLALLLFLAHLRPLAPRRITLLTGPEGGSYHAHGLRYAAALKRHGITADVVVTQGALDNLKRLIGSEVSDVVAFAQSGIERELGDTPGLDELVSLGSLEFEPLWLFVLEGTEAHRIADLAGRSVAVGPKGSGSRAIAETLFEENGIADRVNTAPFDHLEDRDAAQALRSKTVDAVFVVGGVRTPRIAALLDADGIRPAAFPRAPTYAALMPSLASFEILPGTFDLAENRPPTKLPLIAATTNLVAREDLHGAVVRVLLDTARDVHARPTLEAPTGRFPSKDFVSLPLAPRARKFYEEGPTWASRILPYRAAAVVDQIVFVLAPALAALFAVLKAAPLLLGLRFTLRTLRSCRHLAAAEKQVLRGGDPALFRAAIEAADADSASIRVPSSKAASYLELRQSLHDARERLAAFEASR